jgi:hypothetical protein
MRDRAALKISREFLLRLDSDGHYFVAADGREVGATTVLSVARHFTVYAEADRFCQYYRRKGYCMALVTSESGVPVSEADLRATSARS